MKKSFTILFFICNILLANYCFSQTILWNVGHDFIGDNREFTTNYGYPETILGTRLSLTGGLEIDSNQAIFAGGSYMIEHGEKMFAHEPVLTCYYQYTNNFMKFQIGSFPIEIADFPKIAYTDSLVYYRPNYQGARSIFSHKYGKQTVLFDWYTQVNAGYCEKFVTGFSGITHIWNFFVTDMFYYRHHAEGDRGKKSVADNGIFGLNLGYNVTNTWFDSLSVSGGFVNTWYSNHKDTTIVSPLRSLAFYGTAYIQKKFFGIDAIYYKGDGTYLPLGDPLYRCGNYSRIDAILYALNTPNVQASFRWCMHYLDGIWDNSQQIYVRVRLSGRKEK